MYQLSQMYLVVVMYLITVFITMILIQGIVYRLTKFSIYNFVYAQLLKECGYKTGKHSYKKQKRHKKRYVPHLQIETYQIRK